MMLYLYARSNAAAERVMRDIPKRTKFEFAATPRRFIAPARNVRRINWTGPCYLYVLKPEKLVIDTRHKIGTLRDRDAALVTKYWPHGKSRDYVRWRMQAGPTCAIRHKDKLVAWALTHADGAMGMLHVLDEYRGQGLARAITTALARRCLRHGIRPFLYIVTKNKASISLTESMGFDRYGTYCWFGE